MRNQGLGFIVQHVRCGMGSSAGPKKAFASSYGRLVKCVAAQAGTQRRRRGLCRIGRS